MPTILYANSADIQDVIPLDVLLSQIPESLHERAKRYRSEQDAYNFVLGRLLLRKGFEKLESAIEYQKKVPELRLEDIFYNKEEKPLIKGCSFSISHSGSLVACAVSREGAIGLDVEFPREVNKAHFRHCFTNLEWLNITSDTSYDTFYSYWTQKESVLKAVGVGLQALPEINIINHRRADFKHNDGTKGKYFLNELKIEGENAFVCLCTDFKPAGKIKIEQFSINH